MENLSPAQLAQYNTTKVKLQNIASKIKSIVDQGRLIEANQDELFLFKGMYKELKPYFDTFNNCWDTLIELFYGLGATNIFPSQQEKQLQQAVERYYYESCAIYESHMNPTPVRQVHPNLDETTRNAGLNESRLVRARLPQISLPQFNGNQADWPIFHDTFKSLIHDEASISDIEKFHFLISCLKGPALSLIKGISLQEENYEQAWKLLTEQYNDKRRLASTYLKTLLDFKPFNTKPTASGLKFLITTVIESVDSFNQLKVPQADDFILAFLILRCLDPITRRAFEKEYAKEKFPTFNNLKEFLKTEWRTMDLTSEESDKSPYNKDTKTQPRSQFKNSFLVNVNKEENQNSNYCNKSTYKRQDKRSNNAIKFSCPVCKADHNLYHCDKFKTSKAPERLALLKNWRGCTNCLSSKHSLDSCSSLRRCQICNQCHHTWLHQSIPEPQERKVVIEPTTSQANSGITLGSISNRGEVLLGTAVIGIQNVHGDIEPIRIVTDSGSQYSFITQERANRLGLKIEPCSQSISGIGQVPLQGTLGKAVCSLRSLLPSQSSVELKTEAIVVPRITGNLPQVTLPSSTLVHYRSYALADPQFWIPGPVEFLLGGDLYFDIISGLPITLQDDIPKLLPTVFGFVIGGQIRSFPSSHETSSFFIQSNGELKEVMSKFWEVEEVLPVSSTSKEDESCEQHFKDTHYRLETGRYVCSLPVKDSIKSLESPRSQALKRFTNLEAKLAKDGSLKMAYHDFMREYLDLGHMKEVPIGTGFYVLPHHAVTKTINGEMKLRTVFDASCQSSSGSLNDHLYVGPKLQRDISDVLINFRLHAIAFTSDIVKMYRQIELNPQDRPYQHILWRFNPSEAIKEFQLCTITYGLSSAPFMALRTIKQLVEDEGSHYPEASRTLLEDIYVDDVVTGADTIEQARRLKHDLVELLSKGCFQLSKWASNSPALLEDLKDHQVQISPIVLSADEEPKVKLLGMQWLPNKDIFTYSIVSPPSHPTKRAILSAIARIYDPLGFLSPVVFYAKLILQEMWIAKCGWDETGPPHTCEKWQRFLTQLTLLSEVTIPRHINASGDETSAMVIGFCDASQRGYAAVLYLRIKTKSDCHIHLLKAKTKLAPIKPMTIPRLELSGALLLCHLKDSCTRLCNRLNVQDFRFFTDSSVVLGWLATPPQRLNAFVAHRVVQILEYSQLSQWHHVRSEDNPADCGSRGLLPFEFLHHHLWWAGSPWLKLHEDEWMTSHANQVELPEVKKEKAVLMSASKETSVIGEIMERSSSYHKVLRVISYIKRFYLNTRYHTKVTGPITFKELHDASTLCMKYSQNTFPLDKSYVSSLRAFKDKHGLLRVGGRLQNASIQYDAKHPVILSGKSRLAKLIVDHYHQAYLHLGPTALQGVLQTKFWITSARNIVRKQIFQCVKCFKANSKPQAPLMGNLPNYRVQDGQVFAHVGIDFGGPFFIKESNRRKAALGKAYLCLFICMATKAVHLEVVSKCSTEAFIAALDRFTSRRGKSAVLYSDCGTNFVGAANKLKDLLLWKRDPKTQESIINYTAKQEIQWLFNPPSAPHFGGLWEAGIKSAKGLLSKVVDNTPLTFEELSTLFCIVEGVLNSRPITPLGSDPDCVECLTPGHFLIGKPLLFTPEEDTLDIKISPLKRWDLIKQRSQHFWKRWRMEYLHLLQQRKKWLTDRPDVQEGDLVILKDNNCPKGIWPMARIIKVHPGIDGIVRVVTLRTSSGIYKRPLTKLVPLLPVNNVQDTKN